MMNVRYLAGVVAMCGLLVLGITTVNADEDPAKKFAGKKADAYVNVDETQMGYMIMGTLGGGTLDYQGKMHKFKMGGLGVGGMGIDRLKATGDVYEMNDLKDFAGDYTDARIGFSVGDKGKGDLWLKNENNVYIHLKSHLEGISLTLGADAIDVKMGTGKAFRSAAAAPSPPPSETAPFTQAGGTRAKKLLAISSQPWLGLGHSRRSKKPDILVIFGACAPWGSRTDAQA